MKCNHCGADLHIEQEICLYCDAPNPYFKKHREDMEAYEEKFKEAQIEVETHTKKYSKNVATINLICVLLCLNFALLIACAQVDYLGDWVEDKDVADNLTKYEYTVETMLDQRNYVGFSCYMSLKGLRYQDEFRHYYAVLRSAENYQWVFEGLMALNYEDELYESTYEFWIETIAEYMLDLYKIKQYDEYSDMKQYTADHLETMEAILDQTKALLAGYTDLSLSEIDALETTSKAALMLRLEEVLPYEG